MDQRNAFKGRILNFINPIQTIANSLPIDNPIIVVDRVSPNGKQKSFVIEQRTVHIALMFLKDENPFYRDISMNRELLRQLAARGEAEMIGDVENMYDSCNYCFLTSHLNSFFLPSSQTR